MFLEFKSARLRAVGVATLTVVAAGCLPMEPKVQSAADAVGDYGLLNCRQLAAASAAIDLQIAVGSEADRAFLRESRADVHAARVRGDCMDANPIALADARPTLARTEPKAEQVAARAPAVAPEPVKALQAEPQPHAGVRGRTLQLATFADSGNAVALAASLRAEGLPARAQRSISRGRSVTRVLVGPLPTRADIAAVDRAARKRGLRDSFFVKG